MKIKSLSQKENIKALVLDQVLLRRVKSYHVSTYSAIQGSKRTSIPNIQTESIFVSSGIRSVSMRTHLGQCQEETDQTQVTSGGFRREVVSKWAMFCQEDRASHSEITPCSALSTWVTPIHDSICSDELVGPVDPSL